MPSPSQVREARSLLKQAKSVLGADHAALEHLDAASSAIDEGTDEIGRPKDNDDAPTLGNRAKPDADGDALATAQKLVDQLKAA